MTIDRIIQESIDKFLVNEGIFEDSMFEKKRKKHKKDDDVPAETDATKHMSVGERKKAAREKRYGRKARKELVKQATALAQQRGFNVRACAQYLLDNGIFNPMSIDSAQSKLRKKIYNEPAPSGGNYGLTFKEAAAVVEYGSKIANGEGESQ